MCGKFSGNVRLTCSNIGNYLSRLFVLVAIITGLRLLNLFNYLFITDMDMAVENACEVIALAFLQYSETQVYIYAGPANGM